MKNDRAIEVLKAWDLNYQDEFTAHEFDEAFRMAIKALEQQPCEDAISRQAAIAIASGYCHPANVAKELMRLPSVTSTQKWIPVSEGMPEEGEEVLVSGYDTYGKKVIIARYQGEKYGFTCGLVSAWMPLPKPYKPQESEETKWQSIM